MKFTEQYKQIREQKVSKAEQLHNHFSKWFNPESSDPYWDAYEIGDIDGMLDAISPSHDYATCKLCQKIINSIKEGMADRPKTDSEALRLAIEAELDAINLYDQLAAQTSNEDMKKVLLDISKEEKIHVSELETVLKMIDKEQIVADKQGKLEVEKTLKK